jgi:hypothetical protein
VVTSAAKPEGSRGQMGRLVKLRDYPDAAYRDVAVPNADTLYTTAFLDVGDKPWVLRRPRHEGTLLPAAVSRRLDVFAVAGSRNTARRRRLMSSRGRAGPAPFPPA